MFISDLLISLSNYKEIYAASFFFFGTLMKCLVVKFEEIIKRLFLNTFINDWRGGKFYAKTSILATIIGFENLLKHYDDKLLKLIGYTHLYAFINEISPHWAFLGSKKKTLQSFFLTGAVESGFQQSTTSKFLKSSFISTSYLLL